MLPRMENTTARKMGMVTATITASFHWMENITASAPRMVTVEVRISSGPW